MKIDNSFGNPTGYSSFYQFWSDCSLSCGGGFQTRITECRDSQGNVVDSSLCGNTLQLSRKCNVFECPTYPVSLNFTQSLLTTGTPYQINWVGGQLGGYVLLRLSTDPNRVHHYTSPYHPKISIPVNKKAYPFNPNEDTVLYFGLNSGSAIITIPEYQPVSDTYVLVISPADASGFEERPFLADAMMVGVTDYQPTLNFHIQIAVDIDEDVTFRLYGWFQANVTFHITGKSGEFVDRAVRDVLDPGQVETIVVSTESLRSLVLTSTRNDFKSTFVLNKLLTSVHTSGEMINSDGKKRLENVRVTNQTGVTTDCGSFTSCVTCTGYEFNECGWCASSSLCSASNLDGSPSDSMCNNDWYLDSSNCQGQIQPPTVTSSAVTFTIAAGTTFAGFCIGLFVAGVIHFALRNYQQDDLNIQDRRTVDVV